ncbi:MAG TPA: metal-dependent hydrolase [Candidatus Saccharimonadia bacterium]|nr:metal-dependent hydrolase [Candidatus Saccharimonadia bacterium]
MTGRTHDLAAITALGAVALSQPVHTITLSTLLLAIFANLVGGIAPDIDQPTAPLWRNLPVGGYFGRVFDALLGGHRFLTHSILGAALLGWLLHVALVFFHPVMPHVNIDIVWAAFMIGVASHLVMDTFTKEGVPWLLPLPFKFGIPPVKALRVSTGHFAEVAIIFPALLLVNLWLYATHYQQLVDILHKHLSST